jgi:hypothetical protein
VTAATSNPPLIKWTKHSTGDLSLQLYKSITTVTASQDDIAGFHTPSRAQQDIRKLMNHLID